MHLPLRWKILIAIVLAPVALACGAVAVLNHGASEYSLFRIHEDLQRTALLIENTLGARGRSLTSTAEVVVRDPRFFSALALPTSTSDPQYRATVQSVAEDFREVAHADLFEVMDRRGEVVASVGTARSSPEGRAWLVEAARTGRAATGLVVENDRQYQVAIVPIEVHGRPSGALVLGNAIGAGLARELEVLTRSDVSFVSDGVLTGTTLEPEVAGPARLTELNAQSPEQAGHGPLRVMNVGSQTLLTVVRPLPGAAPGGRQFYVLQRSLEAETAYLRRLKETLVQIGFAAVLVALLIGLFVSGRITRPIRQVVRGAEEMERGNYDHPIRVTGRDEIGYLADRFRLMRRHEQVYVNSLQEVVRLKSEFISVASHELRTPVSVIQGFSELFAQGHFGELTEEQKRALSRIDESVERLARITENATRVAQIEGERMVLYKESQAIEQLVEDAAKAALADAPGRVVEVTLDVAPEVGSVVVDGPRLLQAVLQLVRNGIRFTPDGGRVDIIARREPGGLVIEVADTGIGIPGDRLPMLFNRVFMVRETLRHHSSSSLEFNSAGLGLGLSIARGIAEAHDGTIEVTSTPGEGSRFTLRIPVAEERRTRNAA